MTRGLTPEQEKAEAVSLAASIDEGARLSYVRLLALHDWSHEWSDDHRAWERGRDQLARLRSMQAAIDPQCLIWNLIAPTAHRRTTP